MVKKIPKRAKQDKKKPKTILRTIVKAIPKEGISREDNFKKGLLEVDKQEEKYDKLFEQKLAEQYKEFRSFKEHHMQIKKFIGILLILFTIVLISLLLISYR